MKECPFCNFKNEDDINFCVNCGAELSKKSSLKTKVKLINQINNNDVIEFTKDGIIGREGDITSQLIKQDLTISRHHLQVNNINGDWYIEHIGKNAPSLNGVLFSYGDKFKIKNDAISILSIGNQLYKIYISNIKYKYIITCPVCQKVYRVNSINDKIKFCIACDDADKYQIANIKAEVIEDVD